MDHECQARESTGTFARTAHWVEAQASQSYTRSPDSPSPPPSPPPFDTSSLSNRTTTSSDQSFVRYPPALVPPFHPSMSSAPLPTLRRTHQRVNSHSNPHSPLPFPQSPPGSGYPMPLQVAPPRAVREGELPYGKMVSILTKMAPLDRSRSQLDHRLIDHLYESGGDRCSTRSRPLR